MVRIYLGQNVTSLKIKPDKFKHEFTEKQLEGIQNVLENSCTGRFCISRSKLYESVRDHLNITLEEYRFEREITKAIKSGKLKGFETRPGKGGGICKAGVFDKPEEKHQCKQCRKFERELQSLREKVRLLRGHYSSTE